jgi:tetratricopeptide (TPR) repeat protein
MLAERDAARRPAGPAPAYVDSLGRPMTPPDQRNALTAYQTGVALARAGVHLGSLPYFRRALELRPDLWQVHCDYAASVLNSAIEVGALRGKPLPLSRSSIERVAGVHDAFAHLSQAERLATNPADRAYVVGLRARHLAMWGLGWDAFEDYRSAVGIEPGDKRLFNEAAWHARLLRDAVEPGK